VLAEHVARDLLVVDDQDAVQGARPRQVAQDTEQPVTLTDGTRLPVSRAGYARLKALL